MRELTEEETQRLLQLGGGGFDLNNEEDIFQKIQLLMSLRKDKRAGQLSPSQSSNSSSSHMHTTQQQLQQNIQQQQSTQGGQGQQKQTAHKPVAKAHTGRPNPRKRR